MRVGRALGFGLWARKVIRQSGGRAAGARLAWWRVVASGLGAAILLPYVT